MSIGNFEHIIAGWGKSPTTSSQILQKVVTKSSIKFKPKSFPFIEETDDQKEPILEIWVVGRNVRLTAIEVVIEMILKHKTQSLHTYSRT